jgi:hypothetical protein
VVLWTTRNGKELKQAVDWCHNYGLHFCAINGLAPSNKEEYRDKYPTESRKIYADVYIDDHNMECVMEPSRWNEYLIMYLKKGVKTWKVTKVN